MDNENPLLRVYARMNYGDQVFKPEEEVGVTIEQFLDFISAVTADLTFERNGQQPLHSLNIEEKLAYMLSVGVLIGANYEREKHV